MLRNTVGPWKRKDYDEFLKILNCPLTVVIDEPGGGFSYGVEEPIGHLEPDPNGSYELALNSPPAEMDETADAKLRAIRSHPIYSWLKGDQNFKRGWGRFQKLRSNLQRSENVAEVSYLANVVTLAGRYYDHSAEPPRRRAQAVSLRRKTVATAHKLRGFMNHGVRLRNPTDSRLLCLLLGQLEVELHERKSYAGRSALERQYTEWFAESLFLDFNISSTVIVSAWAAMIGYVPDHSTLERHMSRAKQKWKARLARFQNEDPQKRIEYVLRRAGVRLE
jgi:hypothetical protein